MYFFANKMLGDVRFSGAEEFWYTIERLYSEEYRCRYKNSEVDNLDCKNWLESQYLLWNTLQSKEKGKNKISQEIEKIKTCLSSLNNFKKHDDERKQMNKLRAE